MARSVCSLSVTVFYVGVTLGCCGEVKPQVAYDEDWAFNGPKEMRRNRHKRKPVVAKAVGDIPHVAMHKDSMAAPAPGPASPGGPGSPGPGPAPVPLPAPAPAPLTWDEKMAKMKADMTKRVGDSFDADYVIDRPTQFPIKHKEYPVGPYYDIFPDDGSLHPGPGPAPAPPGQGPSPAPMGYIPFTEASLPDHVEHNDQNTMVANFRLEYGPHGPQADPQIVHGPYIDRPFKGWSANPTQAPPPRPPFGFMPRGPFENIKDTFR
jgi:hypothetical protein